MEAKPDTTLTLLSSDGGVGIAITTEMANMSELIKTMAETNTTIPLPEVKQTVLQKVVEYMQYHVGKPPTEEIKKPLKSTNMKENTNEWDAQFIDDVDPEMLIALTWAAKYLKMKPLLDLTCAKIACMIQGKTTEQIRRTFHIQNNVKSAEDDMS